ncbi:thioredoxin family protein [Aspergillus luchuensis]|uniref:Uncharacterized protein n=1 Tax=Aspergillus kawachii TaxID=1069201 RepID=A0A7R7X6B6_ASPKA|nr:uncharacterized protein AKAW2_70717A [Aspergillus luchuensis]BCS03839.1 hypothetical protein AKAW2_70717A [Aspergillus luchuensis]BCS15453.1 hypothetical protein ALUC_70686A [Aspergillus luchuensis]
MFFVDWAGLCKILRPNFDSFSYDYPSIIFYEVDPDDLGKLTADLGVTSVPTFFFFTDGAQLNNLTPSVVPTPRVLSIVSMASCLKGVINGYKTTNDY